MKIIAKLIKIQSILINIILKVQSGNRISLKNYTLYRLKVTGIKQNHILGSNGLLKKCKISIIGLNNKIVTNGSVSKSTIKIFGNNNTIEIQKGTRINNATIFLKGNNCKISIGENTTTGSLYMVCMGYKNKITIGNNCMIADNVEIWNTDSHPILDLKNNIINPSKPIHIGNHIWIGKYCKILKGVSIGDNSIIGMGTIVTQDVPCNTISVGIPNHNIKSNINWDRQHITI